MLRRFVGSLILAAVCSWLLAPVQPVQAAAVPVTAAIFVQNRAGETLADHVDAFSDYVVTSLTQKGFTVLDQAVTIAKFRTVRSSEQAELERLGRLLKLLEQQGSPGVEESLDGASALRIAQMLGADYLLVATLGSFSTENKEFKGYGVENSQTEYRLRLSLKVLEGRGGGTLYGDTITVKLTQSAGKHLQVVSDDILPRLLDDGAVKLAENVASHLARIQETPVKAAAAVEFAVNSNVEALVELDGAVIGSAPGRFYASPGLHQLRLSGQWLSSWEKTVNIVANQALNVTLQLSDEGQRRYASLEQLKIELERARQDLALEGKERETQMAIDKEQSQAEAQARTTEAAGRKTMLEQSRIRIEGAPSPAETDRGAERLLQESGR